MATTPTETKPSEIKIPNPKKNKKARPVAILVIVIIVVVVIGFFVTRFFGQGGLSLGTGSSYQAVFLINGQVYFGRVVKQNNDTVVLKNIYYLRATAPLQQSEEGAAQGSNELSLIKLGNELHGPTDEMRIVRNNVMLIEDLKDDSKVTTAIEDYIRDQKEDESGPEVQD